MNRYDGWGFTLKRLWWLAAKAPYECEICGEVGVRPIYISPLYLPSRDREWDTRCPLCGTERANGPTSSARLSA